MAYADDQSTRIARRGIRLVLAGALFLRCLTLATVNAEPVRSGCEVDYPPFCIVHEDGLADGFAVELLRAALAKMGREVTFRTGPWETVRGWLERGGIDCLPLVGHTPEREELFDFTIPYMTMRGAIIVRADTTGIHTLADLHDRTVGVMHTDNAEEFLRRKERGIDILATPTFSEALQALAQDRCDAVVMQRLVAIRLLEETGLGEALRIVKQPIAGFAQDFCFAVTEGDREMLSVLNEGLAICMADGTHRQLHVKWFANLQLPTDRPIVVGGDHNYPPFEFLDEKGRPAGYNVDLIRAVAEAAGLEIRVRLGSWSEMMDALDRGEIDAMQGMFYSPERDQAFDFSQAHIVNHCVSVVRADAGKPPTSVDDLKGKRIVVQDGDIMHDFCIEHALTDRLVAVDAQEDALRDLAAGKHDCALVTRMTAFYWVEQEGWDNLVIGRTPLASPEYCFAVPDGDRALLAQLSEGLTAVADSGEYRRIHEKWMGVYGDHFLWDDVLKYVAMVAAPLLGVALLALLWSWSLRKQVGRRTAELASQGRLLQAAAETARFGGWSVDLETRTVTWSDLVCDIQGMPHGYSPKVEDGIAFYAPEWREKITEVFTACVEDGVAYDEEMQIMAADGRRVWVRTAGQPIKDERGKIVKVEGAFQGISEKKTQENRLLHLMQVLRAVRNVNQLITHEDTQDTLLRQACEIVTETRGYRSAWIGLLSDGNWLEPIVESGIGDAFSRFAEQTRTGDLPECCRCALESEGTVVMHGTQENCKSCPLVCTCRDTAALAHALRHEERDYGVIVVALPVEMADDEEEQTLFAELAGDISYALFSIESERQREEADAALRRFEWLTEKEEPKPAPAPPVYGDVCELNTKRLILDSVGPNTLRTMATDVMDLLDTSIAIYESNGDYAFGMFVSEWCGLMDSASRALCCTESNAEALQCGRWLCHENCWNDSAQTTMATGEPTDIACVGGIHLYAVPIRAGGETIGAINLGYGNPPTDDQTLTELAATFGLDVDTVRAAAHAYKPRPPFIIEVAKRRLHSIAHLIGETVELVQAQEDLRRQADIIAQVHDSVVTTDMEGRITSVNQGAIRLHGFSEDELLGQAVGMLFPEQERDIFRTRVQMQLSEQDSFDMEIPMQRKSGQQFQAHLSVSLLRDAAGEPMGTVGFALDRTERLRLESQLRQAQKMESVGRLAGGVAHDYNNIVMGILNYADLCRDEIDADHPARPWIDEITKEAQRSANLTRQLLAFARKQTIAPQVVDLNDAVGNMLTMLRRLIGEDIDLAWEPGGGLWQVHIDPGQVDQILANLCVNARDAIEGTGKVTIETENASLDAAYCAEHEGFKPGDFAMLAVSDDGCGMDRETLDHIFEPFYTTKGIGEGTGLGLATVYGIAKQNEGFVNVYSEPGKGTTFRIYLPRFEGSERTRADRQDQAETIGGNETILLVEDEKSIRLTMRLFLEKLGYTVLATENPEKASALVNDHGGAIDLLITDVVMPGMSGRELAESLTADYPALRVLYMSGYTANVIAHRGVLEEGVQFLSKPITHDQLAQKVRAMLG